MIQAAATLSCEIGKKAACEALAVPRASFYRHHKPAPKARASDGLGAAMKSGKNVW